MEARRYEFRVAERLSPTAAAAFPELDLVADAGDRVLFGELRDDAALAGVLERFFALRLTVVDVHRLPD